MNKMSVLKIVNPLLGLSVLFQTITGFFNEYISPDLFETIHVIGGIALIVFAGIHVLLNWGWIKSQYCTRRTTGQSCGTTTDGQSEPSD